MTLSNLLVLYGPPAVGKLTVAEAIATETNYKVFHNHLTADIANLFGPFASPSWGEVSTKLRNMIFRMAVEKDVDLIFTFVYAAGHDDSFIRNILKIYSKGQVHFVQLTADKDVIFQRMTNELRKRFHKVTDPEKAKPTFEKWDLFSPIPFVETLRIDNTHLSSEKAAEKIIEHFGIVKQGSNTKLQKTVEKAGAG